MKKLLILFDIHSILSVICEFYRDTEKYDFKY